MNNIQLFIDGQEVELVKSVNFSITKLLENLSSPTDIINDWSKSISIPFTVNNNKIFGGLYRIDSQVTNNYLPNKELDFLLIYNGSVMMEGYCKINSITKKNGTGTYNVNLFGKIGKIFNELMKITCVFPEDDTLADKYFVGDIAEQRMNKELIYDSFSKTDRKFLLKDAAPLDIIGFTPTNGGYNEDFESNSIELADGKAIDIKDYEVPNGSSNETLETKYKRLGYSLDSVLGDGLLPRQIGEYRSYYQTPYIWVDKMFQILQGKCKELTEYDLILDADWFNYENPYYGGLVMLLNKANTSQNKLINNRYDYVLKASETPLITSINNTYKPFTYQFKQNAEYYPDWNNLNSDGKTFSRINFNCKISGKLGLALRLPNMSQYAVIRLSEHNGIVVKLKIGRVEKEYCLFDGMDSPTAKQIVEKYGENAISVANYFEPYSNNGYISVEDIPFDFNLVNQLKEYNVSIGVKLFNSNPPLYNETNKIYYSAQIDFVEWFTRYTRTGVYDLTFTYSDSIRSGWNCSLQHFWDEKIGFFEQILNYTKMFNLVWTVDNVNKKLICQTRNKYFSQFNGIAEDWTNKIDCSRDYEITPLVFDNKYYLFNYEGNDSVINQHYKQSTGYNFGEIRINTNYAFNNETKQLFKGLQTPMINTENILPFEGIKNCNFTYYGSEAFPSTRTEDNKDIKAFGMFYFWCTWYLNENLPELYITDDSAKMVEENSYCYYDITERTSRSDDYYVKYDKANIVALNNYYSNNETKAMSTFNVPSTSFVWNENYSSLYGIYQELWRDITEGEFYNINTHKLTCYIYLTPTDYENFDFYKFVVVNNVLYYVSKIIDYDINNPITKCELIKVNNVDNYTKTLYNSEQLPYYLLLSEYSAKVTLYSDQVITFEGEDIVSASSTLSQVTVTFDNTLKKITAHYNRAFAPLQDSYGEISIIYKGRNGGQVLIKIPLTVYGNKIL